MTIRLRYGDKEMSWGMPVSAINLQDILDRMNVQSGREIEFMFSKYDMIDLPANILDKWQKADIYKLNVFADRFQRLEDHQKAGFKSVLMRNPDSSIDDMIAMTYGIDCVPVYPAATYAEIGEIAIDNDMLPEIEECSDAVIPKRGEMYVADLGQGIGSEQANERPVIVIQNNKGNHYADTTIIVPITSQMKTQIPNHVIIHYGILTKYKGCVLTEQIRTISVYRLKKYIGRLSEKDIRRIEKALRISLDLNNKEWKY